MTVRLITIAVLPFVVVVSFVVTLARETGRAFYYAWVAADMEIDAAKQAWRTKSMNREDW